MNLHTPHGTLTRSEIHVSLMAAVCLSLASGSAAQPDLKVVLPECGHPHLACMTEELGRLRQAYRGQGTEQSAVAAQVKEAQRFLGEPIAFPPRGGQHNQWYQCDACEIALRTIDATHHECPKCKKVYSGHPYDDVIFEREHYRNLRQMSTAAWAYAISGDTRFAGYAAKVLLGYAERYTQYPYHSASLNDKSRSGGHLFEQTLNEAASLAGEIGPAYDLIHDSGTLSDADHQRIRDGLLLPMLRNMDKHKAGKGNWQTWHNAAMLWGGALVHDAAWVQKAITDKANGFHYQMEVSVSKEGMWYENSWGYHFYTLSALVNMAETARRLKIDLWGDPRLKRMFTLPVHYTMADGSLPRLGDDVSSSAMRVGNLFEPAYHAYKDPQILALLPARPSFASVLLGRPVQTKAQLPPLRSMVFEDAGHAILRAQGPAGLTAAMTFGPYGGFHGHYDKLSFVFFGYGRELGVDPGRARSQAYRLPIHTNWYKATISHNAVLVDGQSQKPATGKLERFEHDDRYTAVIASCDQAYPGVAHRRLLVLTGAYLLVFDELRSDTDRRLNWLYHNRGDRAVCDLAEGVSRGKGILPLDPLDGARRQDVGETQGRDGLATRGQDARDTGNSASPAVDLPGAQYIRNARRGVTDGLIRVRFEDKDVTTYLTMAGGPGTTVTTGDGVGASVDDRVPMVMIARTGRDMSFAAVLEPVRAGNEPQVRAVQSRTGDRGLVLVVDRDGGTDTVEIRPDNSFSIDLARMP